MQLKKLQIAKKPMVVCFVSKAANSQSANAACAMMEENYFKAHEKATFVVVSIDGLANAKALATEAALENCIHVYASDVSSTFAYHSCAQRDFVDI